MQLYRLFDLSINYWIQGIVPTTMTIHVKDGFPTGTLELPTVSITSLDVRGKPFELGGCELDNQFWRIDIFAQNKAQRDALAYIIYKELEDNIPVYNYDVGFPPSVSPPQIGNLIISKRTMKEIHVFEDLVEKMYYRTGIMFFSYYEAL